MKTRELRGVALDWAVAKCDGVINGDALDVGFVREVGYTPSTDWEQAGAIIECEGISLDYDGIGLWIATIITNGSVFTKVDKTPLIAAMRCYVESKLGDDIEVPADLFQ